MKLPWSLDEYDVETLIRFLNRSSQAIKEARGTDYVEGEEKKFGRSADPIRITSFGLGGSRTTEFPLDCRGTMHLLRAIIDNMDWLIEHEHEVRDSELGMSVRWRIESVQEMLKRTWATNGRLRGELESAQSFLREKFSFHPEKTNQRVVDLDDAVARLSNECVVALDVFGEPKSGQWTHCARELNAVIRRVLELLPDDADDDDNEDDDEIVFYVPEDEYIAAQKEAKRIAGKYAEYMAGGLNEPSIVVNVYDAKTREYIERARGFIWWTYAQEHAHELNLKFIEDAQEKTSSLEKDAAVNTH